MSLEESWMKKFLDRRAVVGVVFSRYTLNPDGLGYGSLSCEHGVVWGRPGRCLPLSVNDTALDGPSCGSVANIVAVL